MNYSSTVSIDFFSQYNVLNLMFSLNKFWSNLNFKTDIALQEYLLWIQQKTFKHFTNRLYNLHVMAHQILLITCTYMYNVHLHICIDINII